MTWMLLLLGGCWVTNAELALWLGDSATDTGVLDTTPIGSAGGTRLTLTSSVALPVESAHGIARAGTTIWVGDWASSSVVAVSADDPGTVQRAISLDGANPLDLAWDGTILWVLTVDSELLRVDTAAETTEPAGTLSNTDGLTWDGTYLVAVRGSEVARLRDDTLTEQYATPFDGPSSVVALADGALWFARDSSTLIFETFESESRTSTLPIETMETGVSIQRIEGIAASAKNVWALDVRSDGEAYMLLTLEVGS